MTNQYSNTVLITGGSRGLGYALAQAFLKRKARVVITGRSAESLLSAKNNLLQFGGEIHTLQGDLSIPGTGTAVAFQTQALVGTPDIVINNASELGSVPLISLCDTQYETFQRVLSANLLAPFELLKCFVGPFLLRNRGIFVNISSDAAVEAYPNWGCYGVSKAALDQLTRIWAAETGHSNLRLFAVDPGEMDTKMHSDAIPEADPKTLQKPDDVAQSFITFLTQNASSMPSGSRFSISQWARGAL